MLERLLGGLLGVGYWADVVSGGIEEWGWGRGEEGKVREGGLVWW